MDLPGIDRVVRRGRAELRRAEVLVRNRLSTVHEKPVVLLGNQKSGTTAVAALLAALTGETAALDLMREAYSPRLAAVKAGEISFSQLIQRNRFSFSRRIIKEPQLTPFYDELRASIPQARIGVIVRDPRDNLRSIFDFLGLSPDGEQVRPGKRPGSPSWRLVLDGRWLGIPAGDQLEQAAHRWNLCADVALEPRGEIVVVRYEDFVVDKYGVTAALARAVGLTVVRASLPRSVAERAYQPRGEHRGQSPIEFFGPENLRRIEAICGDRMKRLGYEPSPVG